MTEGGSPEYVRPQPGDGLFAAHLARYRWAVPRVVGLKVLDAGCGEGYGADLLATVARYVTAVDYDPIAIEEARKKYARPNLEFQVMDCQSLAFPNGSFDAVVSFEVIEHLRDVLGFLQAVYRILRPGGILLLSTPNAEIEELHNRSSAQQRVAYHVSPMTARVLSTRLRQVFGSASLFGQRPRGGGFYNLLKWFDRFNLRHRLLTIDAKRRAASALGVCEYGGTEDFVVAEGMLRQSAILLAVCQKVEGEVSSSRLGMAVEGGSE
jgi:SAM-dependent methyltransferase